MREYCTSGSGRGAPGNRRPYRGDRVREGDIACITKMIARTLGQRQLCVI